MKKLEELSFFENLLESPQNELVDKAIEQGRTAIGYNCYVVPEPLISAGNVFPIWMRAPEVTSTSQADYYLSSVVCSYAKAILETGLDGTYDFLGALIFAPSCDHIRRSGQHFELEKINSDNDKFFVYMIDTSNKFNEAGIKWMANDMRKVAVKLNENYDANINEDTLKKSIKDFNQFNLLMKSIADMRKGDNPKLTGTEFHKIIAATKVAPKDMLIEPLKKIKAELEARELFENDKIRLMIVGSTFDNPKFTELIEEQGAIVVADRYCCGSLPGMEPIEEEGDPYINMATYYIQTCQCPRMMENAKARIEYSENLIKEYNVEGIIYETMKFCDLWGYESLSFIKGMKEYNIPLVKIEKEYILSAEGQLRTRIQAFIESIKTKQEISAINK
ncbi:MAG: benzoyl-CoA reductase/2-hydroxyglutaryl-CoA dehydratase subunit BcrC/BadD/HgdB [Clostridium sp.]|jgi:benzoyl-CoA reductase/2-hydroxyglutaryl-CoA dehydratase subunit BcrC/BadD/HgdB